MNKVSYERLLTIFQNYVINDYEASDADYIAESLEQAGLEQSEFEELGFGWLVDLMEEDDEE